MTTVLVLASSPTDQGPLHLGKELKIIQHSRESSTSRDQFRVISCTASTVDDLRRYLLEHSPAVVHFCGHGAGDKGLCFEDDNGTTQFVDGERLAKLFHLVNDDVKCVVLNACLSDVQARAISENIDFVIGMKEEVGDAAAIKFAQGFYEAVWAGQSFEKAFKFGCIAINTANIPEEHVPVILKSPRLGGSRLEYTEDTQRIENFILRFINSDASDRAKLATHLGKASANSNDASNEDPPQVWSSVSVVSVKTVSKVFKEVHATIRTGLKSHDHTFYLKPTGESFLMDWEASCGTWPIPFKTYLALGSPGPIQVRVIAGLSHYFNYGYTRNTHLSLEMESLDRGRLHGFISHGHPDRESLVKLLYDGKPHRIILEIFPGSDETTHVTILKFVSDSWINPSTLGEPK